MDSNSKDYENFPPDGNHYYDQYGNRVESPTPAPSHNNGFHQMYYNNTNTDNNDDYETDDYSMNHKIINYNYSGNFDNNFDEEYPGAPPDTSTSTTPIYFYEKYSEDMKNNPDLNVHSTSYDPLDETFEDEFQGDFREDFKEEFREDFQEDFHNEESSPFIHIMEVAKAAFPYLGGELQPVVDLFIKAGELMESITFFQKRGPISAYSIKKPMDLEGLLTNIRNVCHQKEREMVDMVLNFLKMKNIYETYQTITQMTSGSNMFDMNSPDMMQNLFQMFGNNNFPDMNNLKDAVHSDIHVNAQEENTNTKSTSNHTSQNTNQNANQNNNQNNMTEILQTFLTPEQRETFNTLSTLLQSSQ